MIDQIGCDGSSREGCLGTGESSADPEAIGPITPLKPKNSCAVSRPTQNLHGGETRNLPRS